MRVILNLEETVLEKLKSQADALKRSRKAHMEALLETASENNNKPTKEELEKAVTTTLITPNGIGVKKQVSSDAHNPYNFGDEAFLIMEQYTKYPKKDAPANTYQRGLWEKEKRISDQEIKTAWNEFQKRKTS